MHLAPDPCGRIQDKALRPCGGVLGAIELSDQVRGRQVSAANRADQNRDVGEQNDRESERRQKSKVGAASLNDFESEDQNLNRIVLLEESRLRIEPKHRRRRSSPEPDGRRNEVIRLTFLDVCTDMCYSRGQLFEESLFETGVITTGVITILNTGVHLCSRRSPNARNSCV
jgi:hypothetical protein